MTATPVIRPFVRVVQLGLAAAAIAACVTINVYFPAAAAEKAADQIIDAVIGGVSSGSAPARPRANPSGTPPQTRATSAVPALFVTVAGRILYAIVPAAHAQEANLDIATPAIRSLVASMNGRFGQLQKYFDSGVLGLAANGLVEVRDASLAPLAERAIVTRLTAEDNRDREALYAEIAKANGHPEWIADIRQTFARRWVERGARTGWYYQNPSGAWVQK